MAKTHSQEIGHDPTKSGEDAFRETARRAVRIIAFAFAVMIAVMVALEVVSTLT